MSNLQIMAPVNGQAISLSELKDAVFANKILGDGIAIIPADGTIVSPVNGKVATVAEGKHSYGFVTEDDVDVLVHVGLQSVTLRGEGFEVFVNPGDEVKVGDLIAKVDIEVLREKGINLSTPVIVCGEDAQDRISEIVTGVATVKAGETAVIKLD